jgi:hypothetical protein
VGEGVFVGSNVADRPGVAMPGRAVHPATSKLTIYAAARSTVRLAISTLLSAPRAVAAVPAAGLTRAICRADDR